MKYTYIAVTEWCGLWRGGELVLEGRSIPIPALADFTDQDGDFSLEAVSAYNTKADSEVTALGGFKGVTLDKWLSLAKERG